MMVLPPGYIIALEQYECFQVVARLVKAATAIRHQRVLANGINLVSCGFQSPPGESIRREHEVRGVLILDDCLDLALIEVLDMRQDSSSEHVEETVHFGPHALVKAPDRMV